MSGHKTYKLTYFNGRGRAELSRLIFAAAGQKYEDVRIEFTKWPELKPTTPFGALPVLEIDGSAVLCQSVAIAQYLANEFDLAGKTALDKARAHMIIQCYEDVIKPLVGFLFESDEEKKAELKKKFTEEQLPKFLDALENILKQNNGGDGFFVGDGLTWADLGWLVLFNWIENAGIPTEQLSQYEKLFELKNRVSSFPNVAKWLSERPATNW